MEKREEMLKSKFKLFPWAVLCTAFFLLGFQEQRLSPRLQEKLDHAVRETYGLEEFALEWIAVDSGMDQKAPSAMDGMNLFRVTSGERTMGVGYLGEAPSMKDVFDYVVLFTPDLSVKKAKILIYREDYGRQVGSQRWLKQFIGRKAGESLGYGTDIDGISGATISAKSMTLAVDQVLASMKILQEHQLVP